MPFIPAPNILMCEVRAIKALQHIENRFHVNCGHEPVMADIVAVNSVLSTSVLNDWLPLLPSDLDVVSNFYRSLQTINSIQLEAPYDAGATGTMSGQAAPNQNTICISLRTASAGRSARGRLYWLGLTEDQYTSNTMGATELANIVTAVDTLRANLATAGYPMTIVSYQTNLEFRPGGPVYFPVTSVLAVDNILDSQRRRMPGHGT